MTPTAKIEQGYRSASMLPATIDADNRTVEVTFGTEAHVLRYDWKNERYFYEELGYREGEVRMKRLTSGAAPVLDNHDSYGGARSTLGVVENAQLNGDTGTATLRFSKRADVEPIYQDVLDGIIRTVSVGYRTYKLKDTGRTGENGFPVLRAIDWEPMEISLAPIAADPDSRIRKDNTATFDVAIEGGVKDKPAARAAKPLSKDGEGVSKPKKRHKMKDVNEMKSRLADLKNELVRFDNIIKNGGDLNDEQETRQAAVVDEIEKLEGEINTEERRLRILTARAADGASAVATDMAPSVADKTELRKMAKRATLGDQIVRIMDNKNLDGVIGELTRQAQLDGQTEVSGNGIAIPTEMISALRAGTADNFQIDAGQGSAGKPTEVPSFIEKIFAPFLFEQQGAMALPGLVGVQQFPRQSAHGTSHAKTEVAATENAGIEMDSMTMDARRYTAKTTYSKKMLVQSPINFDSIIANILRRGFERKFEKDCYVGNGNAQEIDGLFNQSGVNTVTPADTTAYADLISKMYAESIRGEANLGASNWVLSPNAWEMLSNAVKVTNVSPLMSAIGTLEGRPTVTSPYLVDPTTGTGRIVFADFSQVYLGFWGSYDLVVDPFTLADNNRIKLVGNMYVDLGLANPSAVTLNSTVSFT